MMLLRKPRMSALFMATAAIGAMLELSSAAAITAPSTDFANLTPSRDPNSALPQHTARTAPVDEVGMKPDLRATTFSRQNAYFFARLSVMAYEEHSEVEGFLAGNSTSIGLGFDRFHWFEVGDEARMRYFGAISDTEAFVAANDDMIVVVFRGSDSAADWATSLKISWRSCPAEWNFPSPVGNVHEGFDDGVSSVWFPPGMHSTIKDLYYEKGKNRKLYLAGHSLGAALATIVAGRLAFGENMDIAGIYTIGSPRVFDHVSAKHFDSKINYGTALKDKHFRLRNNNDIVARVPPFPYDHVGTEIYLDRFGDISTPDLMDRLLGRLSSYIRGEFLDGVADHRSLEYLRRLKQLALDSDVSPL